MSLMNSNEMEIKEKNLEVMKKRIIEIEKYNYKTKNKTESEIIDDIREVIFEEANKKY